MHPLVRPWPLALVALAGCVEPLEPSPGENTAALAPGETRTVELWMLEFNVRGYEQAIDLDTLRELPESTLDDIWLMDMPLLGLVESSLEQLRDLPIDEALELSIPAQNMRTLLRMTPDNAEIEGTSLEELLSLSAVLGIPSANTLADLFDVEVTEIVLPIEYAASTLVEGLIGTHPASQQRSGPVTVDNPDGIYPVAPNSLPITAGDVVNNFESLAARFSPAETPWGTHPGFIQEATGFSVIDDAFQMVVRVNLNAVPYRGLDLTNATSATVNSTGAQIEEMFATDDPDWLRIEGMVDEPWISSLTVSIEESDDFHPGGTLREPAPSGNGTAWALPPWQFEHLVASMAMDAAQALGPKTIEYKLGTGTVVFTADLDESGWVSFESFNNAGNPPPPMYLWDHELEIAQVRLHDGGLAEGDGDIAFTLRDVSVGMKADELSARIADNLAENPSALRDLATAITENNVGAADFYYYRPAPGGDEAQSGDWLYFIAEVDLPVVTEAEGAREYAYANPGFFADPSLSTKVSSSALVHGDELHEKVRIEPGDTVYIQDDQGVVYQLDVREKPSLHRVKLDITRL